MKREISRRQRLKKRICASVIGLPLSSAKSGGDAALDVRTRELAPPDQGKVGVLEVGDVIALGEVLAGPLRGDFAVGDEGDPPAELIGLLEVVRGEQDRGAFGVDFLDVAPELQPQLDV